MQKIISVWIEQMDRYLNKVPRFSSFYVQLFEQRFVSFEEYRQLFITIHEDEYEFFPAYEYFMLMDKMQLDIFLADKKPTFESYWKTFQSEINKGNLTGLRQIFDELSATISISSLSQHIFINGNTGSGKSELLKSLLYQISTKSDNAVVLIDPHGDLSIQLSSLLMKICPERLVYFNPFLKIKNDLFPVFNPLDISFENDQDRDTYAKHLTSGFSELLPNELSVNMKTLLEPCFSVLLKKENATLVDLQKLIKGDASLLAYAKSNAEHHRLFFENFNDSLYTSTKSAVFTKIQSLLNSRIFYHITCQNSGLNLPQALKERKIILFNLNKGKFGTEQSQAFGKLLLAQIKNFVMQQSIEKRKPIYLAIDEAHHLVSDSMQSIIIEARKYKLSLWLSTQLSKQLGSMEDSVLANIGTIFTGQNRSKDALQKVNSITSCNSSVLYSLKNFEFWVEQKNETNCSFFVDDDLIDLNNNTQKLDVEKLNVDFYRKLNKRREEKPRFGDG